MKNLLYVLMFFLCLSSVFAVGIVVRLDDVTFESSQKDLLYKASVLGYKYNIPLSLGVQLENFPYKDLNTYNVYVDNKDIFSLNAHGVTHSTPCGYGEFSDYACNVSFDLQESKFIFMRNMLPYSNVLFLPGSRGDNNTIFLAYKYGYKFLSIYPNPNNLRISFFNDLELNSVMLSAPQRSNISINELRQMQSDLNYLLSLNITYVQIVTHPQDWKYQKNMELIYKMLNDTRKVKNTKLVFINK